MRNTPRFAAGLLALSLVAVGCDNTADNNVTAEAAREADEAAREAERATQLQQQRTDEITKFDERLTSLDRDYQEKIADTPRGTAGRATAGLREELREDVTNVKQAVADLRTTNAENWWERHEQAMKRTADDLEADVKRFAGARTTAPAPNRDRDTPAGSSATAAPFQSARDRFVADMEARLDGWKTSLENVKLRGARQTELEDVRARIDKLDGDVGSPQVGVSRRLVGHLEGAGHRVHRPG